MNLLIKSKIISDLNQKILTLKEDGEHATVEVLEALVQKVSTGVYDLRIWDENI